MSDVPWHNGNPVTIDEELADECSMGYRLRIAPAVDGDGKVFVAYFAIVTVIGIAGEVGPEGLLGPSEPFFWMPGQAVTTTDIDEAVPEIQGSVKWDGCMNWWAGERDVAFHACGADALTLILKALSRAHELSLSLTRT